MSSGKQTVPQTPFMTTSGASPETIVGGALHVSKDVWPGTNIYYLTRTSFQANRIAQLIPNRIFVNVLDSDFTGRIGLVAHAGQPAGPTDVVTLYIQSTAGAGTKCNVFALNPLVNKTGPFQAHCCELDINNSWADEAAYNDPYGSVGLDIESGAGPYAVAAALNIGGYAFAVGQTQKSWRRALVVEYGFDTCGLYMRPWVSSPSDGYIYLLNYDDNNLDTTRLIKCVNASKTVETFVLTKRGEIIMRDIRGSDNVLGLKNISNPADGVLLAIDNISTSTRLFNLGINGNAMFVINAVGGWNLSGRVVGDAKNRWNLTTLGLELADGTNDSDTKLLRNGVASFSVQGGLFPSADATYDLGSGSYRWRNLVISGSLTFGGSFGMSLLPSTNNMYNLGSASYAWSMLFLTTGIYMPGSSGHLSLNSASSWQDGACLTLCAKSDANTGNIDLDYGAYSASSITSRVGFIFYQNSIGTLMMQIDKNGQLAITQPGSSAGIVLGGDANLYRSAANILKTDDSFVVGVDLYMGATVVLTSARVLQNVTANASIINAGTFAEAQIPHTFTNSVTFSGGAVFGSSITPSANNADDLGSSSYKWRDAYLAGSIKALTGVALTFLPTTDASYDLGGSSYRWRDLYLSGSLKAGAIGESLLPLTSNTYSLGSASYLWQNSYFSGEMFLTPAASTTELIHIKPYDDLNPTTAMIRLRNGADNKDIMTLQKNGLIMLDDPRGTSTQVYLHNISYGGDAIFAVDSPTQRLLSIYSNGYTVITRDTAPNWLLALQFKGEANPRLVCDDVGIDFGSGSASTDVRIMRVAANLIATETGDGFRIPGAVRTFVKAGSPVDSDIPSAEDGAIMIDSTNHRIWARYGGAWHYAALT